MRALDDMALQEVHEPRLVQAEEPLDCRVRELLARRLHLDDELHDELRRADDGVEAHELDEAQPAAVVRAERHGRRAEELERVLDILETAVRHVALHADRLRLRHAARDERARHHLDVVRDVAVAVEVQHLAADLLHVAHAQHAAHRHRQAIHRRHLAELD